MDVWTATINLGLATTIAIIFVAEARIRERRYNTERDRQTIWIQDTFLEAIEKTSHALTTTAHLQAKTIEALEQAANTNAHFAMLIQHGICPFKESRPTSSDARPATEQAACAADFRADA